MLIYLAIVAALNLCVGYALGAYLNVLPGVARDTGLDEPLLRPAPRPPAPAPDGQAEPAERESQRASPPGASMAPPPPKSHAAAVTRGLAAFQEQLAGLTDELQAAQDDAATFDATAVRLQEANHAYLESAHKQIGEMEQDVDAAGDESGLRQAVIDGTEAVGKLSDEFDTIFSDEQRDDATRAQLVEKSETLTTTVASIEEDLRTRVGPAEPGDDSFGALDPLTGLATLDTLITRIEALLADDAPRVGAAALLRADPVVGNDESDDLPRRVNSRLLDVLAQVLGRPEAIAAIDDTQYLVLLDDGDVDEATALVERVRQTVAETTFVSGDHEATTTVTCALAELTGAESHEELMQRLNEALAESDRYGANRTFHHDGKFPAPVMAEEAAVARQRLEV